MSNYIVLLKRLTICYAEKTKCTLLSILVPPGNPVITGPSEILLNDNVTLTCSSAGGDPFPTLTWLRGDVKLTTTQTTVNGFTTSTIDFIASRDDHLKVFECQVDNKVLQNALVRTFYVELLSMYNDILFSKVTE